MNYLSTYRDYKKPPFSPPGYLFGPVWILLYVIIAITYGFVFCQILKGNLSAVIALPFAINIIANAFFTYFQFNLKNNKLAEIDILIVLATIIITMLILLPVFPLLAYLQLPYLLWVAFATYLQTGILLLNKK